MKEKMKEKIACIILNYNDADTTEKLVKQIEDYEIISSIVLVDNCSTDNSFERLKEYESEHIHVIKSDWNGGYGYGNNVGIRYAKEKLGAEYCLIANPDVEFSVDVVERLYEFLRRKGNQDYGIVSAYMGGGSCWKEVGLAGEIIFCSIFFNKIFKPRYYKKDYFENDFCDVWAVSGSFLLARTEALYDIGLYDEDIFLYYEENVIACKLKEMGWKSAICTKCKYVHNHSVTIRKNIKSVMKGKRIQLNSFERYLRKYKGVSENKLRVIKILYPYFLFEIALWDKIKSFKNVKKKSS